jgi:2'-5' RNA ligase
LNEGFVFEIPDVKTCNEAIMPHQADDNLKQYFIAIIPPSPVYEEALALKRHFQEQYGSKAALNSPPHITLHMPFRYKGQKESEMVHKLQHFAKNFDPIKVCLDNFASFAPRVIFINVTASEVLNSFQKNIQRFCKKELNQFNANYREEAYHPHLTLAFRDLKKEAYEKAWEEFKSKEYKAEFMADRLSLLKHDGQVWKVFKDFNLVSSYSAGNSSELATTEG